MTEGAHERLARLLAKYGNTHPVIPVSVDIAQRLLTEQAELDTAKANLAAQLALCTAERDRARNLVVILTSPPEPTTEER